MRVGEKMRLRSLVVVTTLCALLAVAESALAATLSPVPDYARGTIAMRASFPTGTAQVAFFSNGRQVATVSVAETASSAETSSSPLRASTQSAKGLDASGTVTWSASRWVNPATFRPTMPTVNLLSRQVVSRYVDVRGSTGRPSTAVKVRASHLRCWRVLRYSAPVTRYASADLPADRGPTLAQVVAYNGFGASPVRRVQLYWVGAVPSATRSCVVDKSYLAMFHIYRRRVVRWWPVAVGKAGTPTPNGYFRIGTPSAASGAWGVLRRRLYRASNGSPTMFYIHGTNAPWSIGTFASHGCVRMYNSHVREFARTVPNRTLIVIH